MAVSISQSRINHPIFYSSTWPSYLTDLLNPRLVGAVGVGDKCEELIPTTLPRFEWLLVQCSTTELPRYQEPLEVLTVARHLAMLPSTPPSLFPPPHRAQKMVKVWYFGLDVTRTAHWTNGWFKLGTLFVSNITFRAKHELTSKVAFDLSQKPGPKARPFETSLRLSRPISAYPRHRSGYLHTPGTGQGTNRLLELVRVPAYPWYWSGYLQGICLLLALVRVPAYPWHWSGYLQGICLLLALVRVPTGYLLTPGIGQGTYRVSAYS